MPEGIGYGQSAMDIINLLANPAAAVSREASLAPLRPGAQESVERKGIRNIVGQAAGLIPETSETRPRSRELSALLAQLIPEAQQLRRGKLQAEFIPGAQDLPAPRPGTRDDIIDQLTRATLTADVERGQPAFGGAQLSEITPQERVLLGPEADAILQSAQARPGLIASGRGAIPNDEDLLNMLTQAAAYIARVQDQSATEEDAAQRRRRSEMQRLGVMGL